MHRRRNTALFLAIVTVAAAGGWFLGQQVTSPAEIAAQTSEPEPSPILVPVESRVLSTDVVTRGTGRFGSPRDVVLPTSALKGEPGIVTRAPGVGTEVSEGDVLLMVAGRPVFVIVGEQPGYRDLGVGMTGTDIEQLESALDRIGLPPGPIDGAFDAATGTAVRRLYERADVAVGTADDEHLAALGSASPLFPGATPQAGVVVPADELLFVPTLPARVAEVAVGPGERVDVPVLTLTDANVAIDGSLPIEQSGLVAIGMRVDIDEPDLGIEATGVVSKVADTPGTNDLDGFHVYFEVTVDEAPANLINASVRLTVPIESTSGDVLAVPIAALNLAADGTSVVRVDRAGSLETVEVRPGLSAQGFVAVEPIGGVLAPGDLVSIGFDRGAGS